MQEQEPQQGSAGVIPYALGQEMRVGVIDVGSNSVRLVVFEGAARSPAYFFNEKVLCGLGKDMADSGVLNPEGRARAHETLNRFAALAKAMEVQSLNGVATAAVRDAEDGPDFVAQVEAETGITLQVASGPEEGRLSAQGVLLGWPDAEGIVCDIGGSSLELAELSGGEIGRCETSALGPLKLQQFEKAKDRAAYIEKTLKKLHKKFPGKPDRMFLVGGSFRAIARVDMERNGYPLKVLHEYRMTPEQAAETAEWCAGQDADGLGELGTDTSAARLQLVPLAAEVLARIVKEFSPAELAISSYGIREGMLYEALPKQLRSRDPLIEACLHMEAASARFPGAGDALYLWMQPLFRDEPKEVLRLIHAASLLHDINWRSHPDYRAETCFETATRANLGGLAHDERIFLGLALLHRYKNSRKHVDDEFVAGVVDEQMRQKAERVGRALRLGAMLAGGSAAALSDTELTLEKSRLTLHLGPQAKRFFGETVTKRASALADSLGAEAEITQAS
ncbi:Ppx/GppA family phosphatase [Paracoccaceae bacterium GXU_MW_L88]